MGEKTETYSNKNSNPPIIHPEFAKKHRKYSETLNIMNATCNQDCNSMQAQEIAPEYLHLYNVSLTDAMEYNNHPFLIDYNNLLCDKHHKYIPISTHNYEICVNKINYLNTLLIPYCHILENNYISTVFWMDKNPNPHLNYYPSQIRFTPYTKTGRKSKYPVYVFLNDLDNEFGSYGIQLIYFKADGKIGKADVFVRAHNKNYNFKVQVREKKW